MNEAIPAEFAHLLSKPVPLRKELRGHVGKVNGLPCLRHPILYSVPYFKEFNATLNEAFENKLKYISEALAEKKEDRYLLLHERPYRSQKLLKLLAEGYFDGVEDGPRRYWQQVGSWWIDSENVHETRTIWEILWAFNGYRVHRSACMTDEERAELSLLPNLIPVWHGEEEKGKVGMSWTVDYAIAKWFAKRFRANGLVYGGVAPKEKVIAYFSRRGESEVLINPNDVQEKRVINPKE